MKASRVFTALFLVATLSACGGDDKEASADDGSAGEGMDGSGNNSGGGDGTGGNGVGTKVKACELMPSEIVSEILDTPFAGQEPMDSPAVSVCSYGSEEATMTATVRIEYNGAPYFDKTLENLEKLGGQSEEVSGVGDRASHHYYTLDFGDIVSGVSSFMVAQGNALINTTVGDLDLSSEVGRALSEELAKRTLARLADSQ